MPLHRDERRTFPILDNFKNLIDIMKKIAIIFSLALLSFSASAQFTRTESDGFQIVATKSAVIRTGFSDRHPFKVSLTAARHPETGEWHHSLMIGVMELVSQAVPKGAVMLIKLSDESVIELVNQFDELQSRDFKGVLVPGSTMRTYTNYASYDISYEQMMSLMQGVKKVRLQHSGEIIDSEYKKEKWAEPISLQIEELRALKEQPDIREGF